MLLAGVTAGTFGATAASASATSATRNTAKAERAMSLTSYRHGMVPMLGSGGARAMSANGAAAASASGGNLSYGGGTNGVGVVTGRQRVYLVFWGSQWGSQGTNGQGNATFSGDKAGMAPRLEAFFKGLGTGGETWSGVMTQYCDGVSMGATSCPANARHAAYPTGGAFAGVWEDTSKAAPAQASGHQIGAEAVVAATHFGNTNQASNINAQYIIVSPSGTNPDNYKSQGFCAWHDYTGDSSLSGGAVGSPDGTLAFTNLPYIPDAGQGCGAGFVNKGAAGALDGVTIVEGHEYAETTSDEYPAGGWTDSNGAENGDKCAWISSGQGASANITLTTGTFAVQSTWSNDFNGGAGGCELSHPIVGGQGGGDIITVGNPGTQTSLIGKSLSLQIRATDSKTSQHLGYSAIGLPNGLTINGATGLISGTPSRAGTFTVTLRAVDSTKAVGTVAFHWTIVTSLACRTGQILGNSGFETGNAAPWSTTPAVITQNGMGESAHSGQWFAWLDGLGVPNTDTLSQSVSISSACHHDTVSFWLYIDTIEATSAPVDNLKVQVVSNGQVLATLGTYSNLNANNKYVLKSFDMSRFAGRTVTLLFTGTETDQGGGTTDFLVDDTALWQRA